MDVSQAAGIVVAAVATVGTACTTVLSLSRKPRRRAAVKDLQEIAERLPPGRVRNSMEELILERAAAINRAERGQDPEARKETLLGILSVLGAVLTGVSGLLLAAQGPWYLWITVVAGFGLAYLPELMERVPHNRRSAAP